MMYGNEVHEIREFNRFYTNILGLLDRHILDSEFSLAEARVLYELSETGGSIANTLSVRLHIDKSYLSRILAKFEKTDLIRKEASGEDGRVYKLSLTEKGKRCIQELSGKSNAQIHQLLFALSGAEREDVRASMQTIRKHLAKAQRTMIRPFTQADIAFVINAQIKLYEKEYGFTSDEWKTYVADGVQKLADRFDAAQDCMYVLEYSNALSGCIAIAHTKKQTAQLRFFFLDNAVRGMGLGNKLMDLAIAFCEDKQYRKVFLWTAGGLDAARHLYQKYGFQITGTKENSSWGKPVLEERWERTLPR